MIHRVKYVAFAAAALSLIALPASAQTKWNLPSAYPIDNPHLENIGIFVREVNEATGGKLTISVHPGASLFKGPEIKRAVATGQAQTGEILISILENEHPIFGIDVVPFLATSFPEAKKLWAASRPLIEQKLGAQGIQVLFSVPWGPQGMYAKKDINTIEDMRGLKWRAYNVGTARIGELVGAQAVTVQAAELPQALATGVVNSFMSSGATGYDSKVWETLTHFYDLQAWIPRNVVLVNKAALAALDKPTQDALLRLSATAEERGWKMWENKTEWYHSEIAKRGMKVQKASPALQAGFRKIGEQLTADWLKRAGAEGKAVVDAYKKM
jgi:TRAP-type C4-dicarboxylate transport system substrate-binding protein